MTRDERLGAAAVGQPAAEGLDRDLRGDLAGLRAAHAVGDDEQRRAREVGVLVALALAAGVGVVQVVGDAQHQWLALALEGELGVADADAVAGVQRLRAAQRLLVEVGAVRRAEVLEHDDVALRHEPRVARRRRRGPRAWISASSPRPSTAPSARS